ncbi:MAG: Inner membrane protein forms channel for type IV secretion of T-DNA complex, VirB3, partial [uncultured Sphingomonas sp.]
RGCHLQLLRVERCGDHRSLFDHWLLSRSAGRAAGARRRVRGLPARATRVRPVADQGQPLPAHQKLEAMGLQQLRAM